MEACNYAERARFKAVSMLRLKRPPIYIVGKVGILTTIPPIPRPTIVDYRAWITIALIICAVIIAVYGMSIGWTTTDILAMMAFFGPLLSAAITYYFVEKAEESRRQS